MPDGRRQINSQVLDRVGIPAGVEDAVCVWQRRRRDDDECNLNSNLITTPSAVDRTRTSPENRLFRLSSSEFFAVTRVDEPNRPSWSPASRNDVPIENIFTLEHSKICE
jgi:hypothetical protein